MSREVCVCPAMRVCVRGGVSKGGVCPGVCVSTGVWVSQHAMAQTPLPPVNRITDKCKNITLPKLHLQAKINTEVFQLHVQELLTTTSTVQECIPVGCVPSAAVAVCWGGCLHQCMLGYTTPLGLGLGLDTPDLGLDTPSPRPGPGHPLGLGWTPS